MNLDTERNGGGDEEQRQLGVAHEYFRNRILPLVKDMKYQFPALDTWLFVFSEISLEALQHVDSEELIGVIRLFDDGLGNA